MRETGKEKRKTLRSEVLIEQKLFLAPSSQALDLDQLYAITRCAGFNAVRVGHDRITLRT